VYQIHKRHFGPSPPADPLIVVAQADSWTLNPRLDRKRIEREFELDPEAAQSEWGGQFRAPTAQYLPRAVVERAVATGITERPPQRLPASFQYFAACDAAGSEGKDSFTLCIGHHDHEVKDRIIVDAVREWRPPFNPETVVKVCAELMRGYGVRAVIADSYAKNWPKQSFARHGVEYAEVAPTKSDIYLHCIPLFTANRVVLLDVPRIVDQFCGLRRKVGQGGRETIDHLRNGHDDLCNAVALLLWKLSPVYGDGVVLVSPGLYTESGGWVSEPRVYLPGMPVPPALSPREQYKASLMASAHAAAGGNGEYGDRGLAVGQGWRRFDHPGDNRSW
jgi:hypothetical protein